MTALAGSFCRLITLSTIGGASRICGGLTVFYDESATLF